MKTYSYNLHMLREIQENAEVRFLNFKFAQQYGGVNPDAYYTVDSGTVKASTPELAAEEVFRRYNADELPVGYTGRSMSVSDIVDLFDCDTEPPTKTSWFCDSVGFIQIDPTGNRVEKS